MHRCFATVIEPLVAGLGSRAIAEVGSGHARLTARALRAATADDFTIHAIDPAPAEGLVRLARADPRVEVHATTGADALGRIGVVDLVLLDGDPNYATTLAELKVVVARSREAGLPAPVIVVHNVHWPFGRRDGYHAADAPSEPQRRPSTASGLKPGRSRPCDDGLRLVPLVALDEGGARNGVLTAVEDFVAGDRARWELLDLPGYGGTAVLVDEVRVAHDARLRGVLATLRSPDAGRRAGRRAEAGRIEAELRALASATERAAIEDLRARANGLERELAAAILRAEAAEVPPPLPAGPDPAVHEAQLRAICEERDRLHAEVRELLEQSASLDAARWRIERLESDLSQRQRSDVEHARERDEQARAAAESAVRLEQARIELAAQRAALAEATTTLAESRRTGDEQTRRIAELADTEQLLSGRVLHLEDSVGAAQAELAEARASAAQLRQRVEHARACDRQAAELVRAVQTTRRARFAAAMGRAFGRSERGTGDRLNRALALLERDERHLAAGPEQDVAADPAHLTAR